MGHLMKPLCAEPMIARPEQRSPQLPAAPVNVGIVIQVPPGLASKRLWIAAGVILLCVVLGMISMLVGDGGEAVIAAKDAHIASLEAANERTAIIAETVAGTKAAPQNEVSPFAYMMLTLISIVIILSCTRRRFW